MAHSVADNEIDTCKASLTQDPLFFVSPLGSFTSQPKRGGRYKRQVIIYGFYYRHLNIHFSSSCDDWDHWAHISSPLLYWVRISYIYSIDIYFSIYMYIVKFLKQRPCRFSVDLSNLGYKLQYGKVNIYLIGIFEPWRPQLLTLHNSDTLSVVGKGLFICRFLGDHNLLVPCLRYG